MPRARLVAIACMAASLSLAVCIVTGCDSRSGATGAVNLRITDAPFPVDLISQATVTITKIDLRQADATDQNLEQPESSESEPAEDTSSKDTADDGSTAGATLTAASKYTEKSQGKPQKETGEQADNADTQDGVWVTVFDGSATFNLLDLRNGRTDVLADATVPAGTYTQMRLYVTEGSVTLKDGRTFNLKVPSGAQSGIKLHFTFTVNAGEQQPLLLDVDLSRAFKPIPGSGVKRPEDIKQFKFQPSLAMRLINVVQAGSISGTVSNADGPLSGVTVTALRDSQQVTSTSTEADGTYTLSGLPTGTYNVAFSAEGYVAQAIADVAVQAGSATEGIDATLEAEAPSSQPVQ